MMVLTLLGEHGWLAPEVLTSGRMPSLCHVFTPFDLSNPAELK